MGMDGEIGEAWIQQHVRTFADGMASIGVSPDEYFVLPRHGWAGSWRYSAALWSGDITSNFAELALQVRVVQVRFGGKGRGCPLTEPLSLGHPNERRGAVDH